MQTSIQDRLGEQLIPLFLVVVTLLSYARIYMLHDVYADDNCWLLGIALGYDLPRFLSTGFLEMRREALGVFLYFFFLPFRLLDNPYVVWHSIVLGAQVLTPLVCYQLIRRLSSDFWLAGVVATILIVIPLDSTIPYLSGFNYRLVLLFALASLYLTDAAVLSGRWGWRMPASLVFALIAEYVFHEAAVGLEPARLLLLWFRLHRRGQPLGKTAREILRFWYPFVTLSIPLLAYKILFKPFGIYASMYGLSIHNLADHDAWRNALEVFNFGYWKALKRVSEYGAWVTLALASFAVLPTLAMLQVRRRNTMSSQANKGSFLLLAALAATILAPQLLIFFLVGRPPKLGFDSTHAALMQPAFALIIGLPAYAFLRLASKRKWAHIAVMILFSTFVGGGVYFNNLNLDLYAAASRQQAEFWSAFRQRFPQLPERADFLIDARPRPYNSRIESFYEWEDLQASYDLEYPLNEIYSGAARTSTERRYRVYSPEEFARDFRRDGPRIAEHEIGRQTHYGVDHLDPAEMTIVFYRDGELLVNREIIDRYPTSDYRSLADKPLPGWARSLRSAN